ncbi:S-layer homology domain-containing protein [Domibacillus tundrae]|uniref:S-layer homology domain-containing protein n=1 Tax=Domibacillus tundrae TaxID=1587527 RepID=UPI000697DD0A|nr:S-layer homology domain-containing protein [Domibacillus tundrae]
MKKPLKVLATTLVAGTIFSSTISPSLANTTNPPLETSTNLFTDVKAGTKLGEAVEFLVRNGIARGYDEAFGVNDSIKRVDFAVILGNYLAVDTANAPKSTFRDLPFRASGIVSALKAKGIVNGKTATSFGAGDNITRGEAAIMLYRAFKDDFYVNESTTFTDVSPRYIEAVGTLFNSGIIAGLNNGKFGTDESLTRGQMALLIKRIYDFQQSLKNEKRSGFVAFGDSNTSSSYFETEYPEYVSKRWTDQVAAVYGEGLEEYNAGNSGYSTRDSDPLFQEKVLNLKPSYVTILFGINDALIYKGEPQVSKEDFKKYLTKWVSALRARDTTVVLLTNPPIIEETYYKSELNNVAPYYKDKGGLRAWINSYNDIIRQVAKEQFVPVVDVYDIISYEAGGATDDTLMKSGYIDSSVGIHLTPKANNIVANEVKKILADDEELLTSEQDGVFMNAEKKTYKLSEIKDVKLTIENKSDVSYNYAPVFTIQKKVATDWVTLDQDPEIAPPAIINSLEANKTVTEYAHFSTLDLPVTTGTYRIVHTFGNESGKIVKLAAYIDVTE